MGLEVLSKEEIVELIKEHYPDKWFNRKSAARYLDMALSTFDEFIRDNPHLRHRNQNKRTRFKQSELDAAFNNRHLKVS